jgi:SAM-dependent methyltransferase
MNRNDDTPRQKVLDLFSLAADLPAKATADTRQQAAVKVGYGEEEFANAPEDALLGIGCGNPVALASLEAGQVVLDLGSGAGFDAFLASKAVGSEGSVIGVDFNPKMLARARQLAREKSYRNVEFREGAIEDLPIESETIDVVLSNCVINLCPAKERVYRDAMRVLKPGGRLMISDLIVSEPMPGWFLDIVNEVLGFKHWLLDRATYFSLLETPGFVDINVVHEISGGFLLDCQDPACDSIFSRVPEEHRPEIPALAESITSIDLTP